jgi:hypothetical protein
MFAKTKPLQQNNCGQIFCTDFQWQRLYLLKPKAEAHLALDVLHRDVGVFNTLIPNNAMELTEGDFKCKALWAVSCIKPVESYLHNQNLAESAICDLRRMFHKAMRTTGPICSMGSLYVANVRATLTYRPKYTLIGRRYTHDKIDW